MTRQRTDSSESVTANSTIRETPDGWFGIASPGRLGGSRVRVFLVAKVVVTAFPSFLLLGLFLFLCLHFFFLRFGKFTLLGRSRGRFLFVLV